MSVVVCQVLQAPDGFRQDRLSQSIRQWTALPNLIKKPLFGVAEIPENRIRFID